MKPGVEIERLQTVISKSNGFLAADLLQNQPGALQFSTMDCASSTRDPAPDQCRPRNETDLSGKAGMGG
jgi:hypothetical protein